MENKKRLLLDLLKREHIQFKSLSIYIEAVTHKSYANEARSHRSYQRLEFLGDACIDWVISNFIYSRKIETNKGSLRDLDEGEMTRVRSKLVKTESLARAAVDLGLDKVILVGHGFENTCNINLNKIHEDVFESFIGAVAQDQGIKKVIKILDKTLIRYYNEGLVTTEKDYKTIFQEEMQKISKSDIHYLLVENNPNQKVIHLLWNGLVYGIGAGRNRKEAEYAAAKDAFEKIRKK